ncbi:hypothetical protein ACFE04_002904 [Oxalis oulophora]
MATLRIPDVVPSPEQDCERLYKAFKGLGTDEESVIWVLGHRDSTQRNKIRDTYQQLYKKSLIDALHSELSGDFRRAVIMWTTDPSERDAKLVRDALHPKKKGGNRQQIIVEIACSCPPQHLMGVRKAYCSLYDCSLEEDIASNISQPLQKILLGFVSSYRYDKEAVDIGLAKNEADKLYQAIQAKQFDHDDFVFILATRNFYQLRATFQCYQQNYGNYIDEDIKSCGNDELEALLKVAIQCIDVPERHFAEVMSFYCIWPSEKPKMCTYFSDRTSTGH